MHFEKPHMISFHGEHIRVDLGLITNYVGVRYERDGKVEVCRDAPIRFLYKTDIDKFELIALQYDTQAFLISHNDRLIGKTLEYYLTTDDKYLIEELEKQFRNKNIKSLTIPSTSIIKVIIKSL